MSLASVFQELEAEAKAAVTSFEGGVVSVAEKLGPIILTDIENFLRDIGSIALQAVMAELPKTISGDEKFGNAVAAVVQTVEAKSKPILVQQAQQAVQNAFTAVQSAVANNPPPAA